jgi:hypothetical protein
MLLYNRGMQKWINPASYIPAILFPLAALTVGLRNAAVFDAPAFLTAGPVFPILFVALVGGFLLFRNKFTRLQENFSGLLLFFLFTSGYFLLSTIFNKEGLNTNNVYFAADNWSWAQRMAAEDGWNLGTRAVHPLAHLIFRPLAIFVSLFTGGDRFYAVVVLLALAGGGCVLLTWKILNQVSENDTFAVLFASLLGLSASQLVFASVIESYIFSTLCLLFFIWLLMNKKPDYLLVITGVITLGITITNIAQQGLAALFIRRNYGRLILLFIIIVLVAAGLNIASRSVYPVTEYFFIPGNMSGEQRFAQEVNLKRAGLMVENILLYAITPPEPYASMRNYMPRFNFLNGTISEYPWFGWPALASWTVILCLAIVSHLRDAKYRHISTAMLACLLFNFVLHIGYGIEPFLYSADWTYALILFTGISLVGFAERTWFKFGMLAALFAILLNNLWFVYLIARKAGDFLI